MSGNGRFPYTQTDDLIKIIASDSGYANPPSDFRLLRWIGNRPEPPAPTPAHLGNDGADVAGTHPTADGVLS